MTKFIAHVYCRPCNYHFEIEGTKQIEYRFVNCPKCGCGYGGTTFFEEWWKRRTMIHRLKCIEPFYTDAKNGKKPFEIRLDDRGYTEGDYVELHQYDPLTEKFSGKYMVGIIAYLIRGTVCLKKGYCAFMLKGSGCEHTNGTN